MTVCTSPLRKLMMAAKETQTADRAVCTVVEGKLERTFNRFGLDGVGRKRRG